MAGLSLALVVIYPDTMNWDDLDSSCVNNDCLNLVQLRKCKGNEQNSDRGQIITKTTVDGIHTDIVTTVENRKSISDMSTKRVDINLSDDSPNGLESESTQRQGQSRKGRRIFSAVGIGQEIR